MQIFATESLDTEKVSAFVWSEISPDRPRHRKKRTFRDTFKTVFFTCLYKRSGNRKDHLYFEIETQDKYFTSTTKGGLNGEYALFWQFLKNCICGDARGTVLEIMEHSTLILQSC